MSTTASPQAIPMALDHLVVVAHTLADGVAWCERTLGVTPAPGGEHPLMGTHNRLLAIGSSRFPAAYLEIIATNIDALSDHKKSGKRWFDMDFQPLQHSVQHLGPQLVHWVARVPDLTQALHAWHALGLEPGVPTPLSRMSPSGPLNWQLTVRPDGQRPMQGCLPTLIEWAGYHPCDSLPPSGVTLQSLQLAHPQAPVLQQALAALGPSVTTARAHQPSMHAVLATPEGPVTLSLPLLT